MMHSKIYTTVTFFLIMSIQAGDNFSLPDVSFDDGSIENSDSESDSDTDATSSNEGT